MRVRFVNFYSSQLTRIHRSFSALVKTLRRAVSSPRGFMRSTHKWHRRPDPFEPRGSRAGPRAASLPEGFAGQSPDSQWLQRGIGRRALAGGSRRLRRSPCPAPDPAQRGERPGGSRCPKGRRRAPCQPKRNISSATSATQQSACLRHEKGADKDVQHTCTRYTQIQTSKHIDSTQIDSTAHKYTSAPPSPTHANLHKFTLTETHRNTI